MLDVSLQSCHARVKKCYEGGWAAPGVESQVHPGGCCVLAYHHRVRGCVVHSASWQSAGAKSLPYRLRDFILLELNVIHVRLFRQFQSREELAWDWPTAFAPFMDANCASHRGME